MEERESANGWRRGIIGGAVAVLGVAALLGNRADVLRMLDVVDRVGYVAYFDLWYGGILLMLAAFLRGRAQRGVIWFLVGAAAFELVVQMPRFMDVDFGLGSAVLRQLLAFLQSQSLVLLFMLGALLMTQRLRAGWQWVAWVTLGMMAGDCMLAYLPAEVWSAGTSRHVTHTVVRFGALALVMVCAWFVAFRRGQRHVPPGDAQRMVKLTCPRCGSAEEITTGHGACGKCRLQISIALEEGVCEGCGYMLRGLTGDKCPECGREINGVREAGDAAEFHPDVSG